MEMFFIFYLVLICLIGTYIIAKRYNRNYMAWTISAILFGSIFVLPILLIVGKKDVA
jgi:hypothetical protein